ncbi:MAG: hypothetical protein Q9159_005942 [Coniocarpon cinnabarinum]
MSITGNSIWAASPTTTRGQPTILSADPKGERIAYASNKSIFLRSIDNPAISTQYTQHTAQTTVARFSPSGFYVASGDVSGSVRVWDCKGEGATKGEYHIIAGRISDIAWDGDSQRIIAVGDGKERYGHCITADSGNSVGEISGHSGQINSVSIRQQRPLRAATASDDTSVVFLHGAPFKYNTSLRDQHQKFVYATAFSPDGSFFVSVGQDRNIWLYDGKTGEPQKQIGEGEHTGSIFGVSWSQDSKNFVTCSADQTVKLWDVEGGKVKHSWRMGGDGVSIPHQQVGVVWPHGRTDDLVISLDLDGNLNYLYTDKTTPTRTVTGHQKNITAAALTAKSGQATIWTGSSEGRVRTWDVASGTASSIDGESPANYVFAITPSHDHNRVYTAAWDDTLRTIDVGASTFTGSGMVKLPGQPKGLAASTSSQIIVATPTSLLAYQDGSQTNSIDLEKNLTPTALAASNDTVVLAADDKKLYLYTPTLNLQKTVAIPLNAAVSTLAFSPDHSHLAIGTASGGITVLSTSSWEVVTTRWSAHTARVASIAWSPDGKYAVSGSLDTNVFIWSLSNPGRRVKAAQAHKEGVNGVVWIGEGLVGSVGADAAVRLWDVRVE